MNDQIRSEPWTRVAIPIVRTLAVAASRPEYRGRGHIPRTGGVILAVNHLANVDPVLLARFVLEQDRVPRFLAKYQLFETFAVRRVLRGAKQIPVYRGRENASDALAAATAALRDGELVVIYPEGTLTTDPAWWPMLARTGVARLAFDSGAPVVPVAHWGAHTVIGPGWRVRPRQRYSLLAGPAVRARAAGDRTPPTPEALGSFTDTVMQQIRAQLVELRDQPAPALVWDPQRRERVSPSHVRTEGEAA
jgi:1-acyl-sn-glycerol-3-phosphate acyltransferase